MEVCLRRNTAKSECDGIGKPNSITCDNLGKFGRGMVIACLNINSLVAHIDELRIFITNTKIGILCINETKLDQTISDHEVCLPGFDIIRKDRRVNGRHGGGVCIYVRANLNFKIRNDSQSEILENLMVEIIKPQSW